jgi:hypothetical protein
MEFEKSSVRFLDKFRGWLLNERIAFWVTIIAVLILSICIAFILACMWGDLQWGITRLTDLIEPGIVFFILAFIGVRWVYLTYREVRKGKDNQ